MQPEQTDIVPPDPKLFPRIYDTFERFVYALCDEGIEVGFRCEFFTHGMWTAELLINRTPNRPDGLPDVSTVLFVTGCHHAEHCLVRLFNSPEIMKVLDALSDTSRNRQLRKKIRRLLRPPMPNAEVDHD